MTPVNGATIVAQGAYEGGFAPIPWTLVAVGGLESVTVNLAATAAIGKGGYTLSDLDRLQSFPLSASATNEALYTGIDQAGVYSGWSTRPGTYYWQIEAEKEAHGYFSPIFSLSVVAHGEPGPRRRCCRRYNPLARPSQAQSTGRHADMATPGRPSAGRSSACARDRPAAGVTDTSTFAITSPA